MMRTQPAPLKRKARAMVRRAVVEVLARTDRPDKSARPTDDLILLLHHMTPSFLDLMDHVVTELKQLATPVSYREIVSTTSDAPRFCVTFDDGNKSQMDAAERLAAAGVPACFFIIGDALDADDAEAARICRDELWMEPVPFMVRDDLDRLLTMGHEVGSHTMGHLNLAQISDDQVAHQVGESYKLLSPWMGDAAHFAWPFGGPGDFTRAAYDSIRDTGYVSCATAMRGTGVWRPESDGPPLVFRQSLDLRDSLAVQRRFLLNSDEHLEPSKQALAYLR